MRAELEADRAVLACRVREPDHLGRPDGTLLVACRNRRATRCPSCADTYRQDSFHLIAAGLRGGKGIPDSVAATRGSY